jgi:hypothetical protein
MRSVRGSRELKAGEESCISSALVCGQSISSPVGSPYPRLFPVASVSRELDAKKQVPYSEQCSVQTPAPFVPRLLPVLALSEANEQQLRHWVAAFGTPQQVSLRSRIVLAAAAGESDSAIVRDLDVNRNTVILWRARFEREGLDGLWEVAPGREHRDQTADETEIMPT